MQQWTWLPSPAASLRPSPGHSGVAPAPLDAARRHLSNQKTIFVILSAAENLSGLAAEILHEAQLRSE